MKLSGIRYLTNQGIENIWKNKMMAFATFCVLLISLLLVGCAGLFYLNMDSMILGLGNQNEIAIYLYPNATEAAVEATNLQLQELDNIDTVQFIPKEEAYQRMRNKITSQGQKIFQYIDDSQFMPDGFSVTVIDNDRIEETTALIAQIESVESASSSPRVAEFLRELRRFVTIIASAAIVALTLVSLIMISNTTKASVFARREEIQIMKYVGATNTFIRTPFFVEGMVTGFFAGVGAFFITWAMYDSVYNILQQQRTLMSAFGIGSIIEFDDVQVFTAAAYLIIGAIVGATGSVISTRRHLDV